MSLEADLERARGLSVGELADAIETIGFECTRCGACCRAVEGDDGREDHTATVFPDEVRDLQEAGDEPYDWRDVARPMPYGLAEGGDGPEGETFEWALQTDACGDCAFYRERESRSDSEGSSGGEPRDDDGTGVCTVHGDRPLICRTYPFSVVLDGETAAARPTGEAVDREGPVRAHECEGLGRDIAREDAKELAAALKERAVRELEEAIAVREGYEPTDAEGVVVHDSEGQKRPDGTPLDGR